MHLLVREPIQAQLVVQQLVGPADGAVVTFEGVVRDHARGKAVLYLEYEAYEPMASTQMEAIVHNALEKWPVRNMAIVHRLGRLEIGECSVLIAVVSEHRKAAFEACQFAIDALKQQVPIWKREFYTDGAAWIEGTS
jgi:molybdopterin synthase catalytic subunit